MVEAGEDLRLPLEPSEAVRIGREGVGEDLQGDLAVELGVGGLPDLAHAALAEEGGDVVAAKPLLRSHQITPETEGASSGLVSCIQSTRHPRTEADLPTGAA